MFLGEREAGRDVLADVSTDGSKGVGVGQEDGVRVRRRTGIDVHAGHAHRDPDTTVVAVLECDDGALSAGVPARPQRHVVGVGAGVAEVYPSLTGTGDQRQEVLGEPHRIGMYRGEAARAGYGNTGLYELA